MGNELIIHLLSIIVPFLTLGVTIASLRLLVSKSEAKHVKKKANDVCKNFCPFYQKKMGKNCCAFEGTEKCRFVTIKKQNEQENTTKVDGVVRNT